MMKHGCAVLFVAVILLLTIASFMRPADLSRVDEVHEGCIREFGDRGPDAVMRCQTEILARESMARDADRMRRAAN